jgi:hypothetical protein
MKSITKKQGNRFLIKTISYLFLKVGIFKGDAELKKWHSNSAMLR